MGVVISKKLKLYPLFKGVASQVNGLEIGGIIKNKILGGAKPGDYLIF